MKNHLVLSLSAACTIHGATVSVTNVIGSGSEYHLRASTGADTYSSGVLAIYDLSDPPASALAARNLGTTGRLSSERQITSADIVDGNNGAFDLTNINIGSRTRAQAEASTLEIYLVFGNAATLADSTEVGVAVLSTPAQGLTPGSEAEYRYSIDKAADLIIGTRGTGTADYSGFGESSTFAVNTFMLEAVPEPSSALLALVGLAGLARRSRS